MKTETVLSLFRLLVRYIEWKYDLITLHTPTDIDRELDHLDYDVKAILDEKANGNG